MIELKDGQGREVVVDEGESATLRFTIMTDTEQFVKLALTSLTITLFDLNTGIIIGGWDNRSILDENNGEVDEDGNVVWGMLCALAVIITPAAVKPGRDEAHIIRVKWSWITPEGEVTCGKEDMRFWVRRNLTVAS